MISDLTEGTPSGLYDYSKAEYWDSYYRLQNGHWDEWYVDWADLQGYLSMLVSKSKSAMQILMAGSGNSELSSHMYDAGWHHITNIDFSKVVIAEMLRLHVRSRPHMRWLVMDMTHLQFADNHFDLVMDKGGLDSLMGDVDKHPSAALSYLSEVKRVLRPGGKYVCVTLAKIRVLGLVLETFRQGWILNVQKIFLVSDDSKSSLHPYLISAVKSSDKDLAPVRYSFCTGQNQSSDPQMQYVVDAIKEENRLRNEGVLSDTSDMFGQLHEGHRTLVKLGGQYPALVLDAKPNAEPPDLRCGVFLVPKGRAHEWLFSSEEGQWQIIESAQAGRLILVTLDDQQIDNVEYIKQELAPSIKPFLPLDCRDSDSIPYMTTKDALRQRIVLEEIESPVTGIIHVEDVAILDQESTSGKAEEAEPSHYRRLYFRRNPNLIQSEASLVPMKVQGKIRDRSKNGTDIPRRQSGNKKKHKVKDSVSGLKLGMEELRVDHSHLASDYHAGMIAGLSLIAHNLEHWVTTKEQTRVMIVGLGAGLLPMFVHNHIPVDSIQVVELDAVVGEVAQRHFGFVENERMQLIIANGIEAVAAIARGDATTSSLQPGSNLIEESFMQLGISSTAATRSPILQVSCSEATSHTVQDTMSTSQSLSIQVQSNGCGSNINKKLHILIIDADSEDPSTGLSCPSAGFLEEPFLRSARGALVEGGILAINLVSHPSSPYITSVALLQKVFEEVYDLEVEGPVNRVLFALPQRSHRDGQRGTEMLQEEARLFEKLVATFASWGRGPPVEDFIKKLKRLK